jgi:hypothetical protein
MAGIKAEEIRYELLFCTFRNYYHLCIVSRSFVKNSREAKIKRIRKGSQKIEKQ